jgi:hypothetical protein
MEISNEDIVYFLKDIITNDIPFWELDTGYFKEGLTCDEQKEWALACCNKAIEIINTMKT